MKIRLLCQKPLRSISATALSFLLQSSLAQPAVDAGTLLRQTERPRPLTETMVPEHLQPESLPSTARDEGLRFVLRGVQLEGALESDRPALNKLLARCLNRSIGFSDLRQAAIAVNQWFAEQGRFVRAVWPPQEIQQGIATLRLVEAFLQEVQIQHAEPHLRMSEQLIKDIVAEGVQQGQPLNEQGLERLSLQLREIPGLEAKLVLAPGKGKGDTVLLVQARDKKLLAGRVLGDNFGSSSTGAQRVHLDLSLDDPSGHGDQALMGATASQGMRFVRLGYSTLVGPRGLRLGLDATRIGYRVLNQMSSLDAKGRGQSVEMFARWPLRRKAGSGLDLNASLARRDFHNEALGLTISDHRIHALTLELQGSASCGLWGEGGFCWWSSGLTLGHLDLSADPGNQLSDSQGPRSQGNYKVLRLSASTRQALRSRWALSASFAGQWASKNLDSSEQFALGGPSGVRAYPLAEASGDSAWTASLELFHDLPKGWQLAGFYDLGQVWVCRQDFAACPSHRHYALQGLGLDLRWLEPGKVDLHLSWARRLAGNPGAQQETGKDSDGSKRIHRIWASASWMF